MYAVYANAAGEIFEDPELGLLGRTQSNWLVPDSTEMIPLPGGASLVSIPRFTAVGINTAGSVQPILRDPNDPKQEAIAVAALLPQGFTRTLLPACVSHSGESMPLYGYAAVGFENERFYVAAVQSDAHYKWHPKYFNTARLMEKVEKMLKRFPEHPIVQQIAKCSLEYGCYTAQNFFYQRWEAGIPTYPACNAGCIGCISQSHIAELDSPQQRVGFAATIEDIAEMGAYHLKQARQPIISFGQGCEGEPTLNAASLAPAIEKIRQQTPLGIINCNTNAGYTTGVEQMVDAGLNAMRVTIFSAQENCYSYYHQPRGYVLADVIRSIDYAKKYKVKVSLNLLVFPGFTDRYSETAALIELVKAHGIDMIQLRNLNLDPDVLGQGLPMEEGEPLSIPAMIRHFEEALPQVKIGSYTHY